MDESLNGQVFSGMEHNWGVNECGFEVWHGIFWLVFELEWNECDLFVVNWSYGMEWGVVDDEYG